MAERLPRIFGDYVLLDPLGHGATGDVYLARPLAPNRGIPAPLVIKRLHQKYLAHEEFIKRFRHEAEIAILVDSPHVAKVYEVGAAKDTLFIAMEFVPGFPASHLLAEMIEKNVHVALPIAVEFMAGGLSGLHMLHTTKDRQGRPLSVVHRDISPKNLMAGSDGLLHLIDLGLGKSNAQDWKTDVGTVMGSPGYMAPEQIRGLDVDSRADVYAMGVVLFELLTLRRYVKREAIPEMLSNAIQQPFIPPSEIRRDVPPALDRVIARALAKHVEDRYPSAADFSGALREAVPEPVRPDTMMEFMRRVFGDDIPRQAKVISELLDRPIPDLDSEPTEGTSIFALHPTVSNVPSPIQRPGLVRPQSSASAITDVPTLPPSLTPSMAPSLTPSMAPSLTPSMAPSLLSSLTPITDRNAAAARAITMTALSPTSISRTAELPALLPPPTVVRGFAWGRLTLLATAALVVGLSFGIAVMHETLGPAPEAAPETDTVIIDADPGPRVRARPMAQPEPADSSTAENRERAKSAPKSPRKTQPSDRAGPSDRASAEARPTDRTRVVPQASLGDTLSKRAKSIEDRANALKARVVADEAKSRAVQRLLYDLSLVRASKNADRALEQLADLESKLAALEAPN